MRAFRSGYQRAVVVIGGFIMYILLVYFVLNPPPDIMLPYLIASIITLFILNIGDQEVDVCDFKKHPIWAIWLFILFLSVSTILIVYFPQPLWALLGGVLFSIAFEFLDQYIYGKCNI